uniref:Glutathione transferase n=1 Tax=Octopus bimaculoides TaxID=37653 RepID=A0A0L8G7J7_OCTBM|eukprot:XP_014783447.1 PREDICTED: S-crystallin 2-like [Octopus bimaculoides]
MPSYTLHYFNHRGRAEICRMLFAAAGVQYNDRRIESSEWSGMRSRMPCSMLPMLEIDNKTQIPQSMAIARYLAREFGFHGKNNMDMAKVDYVSDCFYDIMDDYMRMYHDRDGRIMFDKMSDMRQRYCDMDSKLMEMRMRFQETCRRVLPFLERCLEMQHGGNQFFLGDHMTMSDMMCYTALENPLQENPSFLNNYPKLRALRERVCAHCKISPYIKRRHHSSF